MDLFSAAKSAAGGRSVRLEEAADMNGKQRLPAEIGHRHAGAAVLLWKANNLSFLALLFRGTDGGMHVSDGSLSAAGCAGDLSLCRVGTVVDWVGKRCCVGAACSGRSTGGMPGCRMRRAMEKQPSAHSSSGICLWQRLALRRGAVVCFSSTEWNNGLCFGRTGGFVPAQRRYIFAVFAAGGMWGRTALKTPADRLCQRKIGGQKAQQSVRIAVLFVLVFPLWKGWTIHQNFKSI